MDDVFFAGGIIAILVVYVLFRVYVFRQRHQVNPFTVFSVRSSGEQIVGVFALLTFLSYLYVLHRFPFNAFYPSLLVVGKSVALVSAILFILSSQKLGASWRIGLQEKKTGLIKNGIFARIRNPVYDCLFLISLSMWLMTQNIWTFSLMIFVAVLIRVQVSLEEESLLAQHGPEYEEYQAKTGRFFPRL